MSKKEISESPIAGMSKIFKSCRLTQSYKEISNILAVWVAADLEEIGLEDLEYSELVVHCAVP